MRSRLSGLPGLIAILLAGAFVGLAAAGGWLYWNHVERRGAQQARTQLAPLAAAEIPKMFGYDFQTVERSLTETYPLLTPEFRREFESRAVSDIIPQARDRQIVSQVNVVGVGVLDARRVTGSVMVYINRTVSTKGNKEPLYDGSRLRVDYQKVAGKWLIDGVTPI